MSTLIQLTAEQVELVRYGVLSDATFQPMPMAAVKSFESAREGTRRARRAPVRKAAEPRRRIDSLDREVAAEYWKHQTIELALLIGNVDLPGSQGSGWAVVALARAHALGRLGSGTTGVRNLEIRNWTVLATPIPVDAIISGLPVNEAHWWRRNLHASARPIPPSTDEATLRQLRQRITGFDEIVRSVLLPPAPAGGAAVAGRPALQEARDANMTAARLFSPDWRDLEPVPLSDEPSAEVAAFVAELRPDENDLIQDDIIPFEGWEQHRSQGGWVEFQSEGRRLLVKNINFKLAETQTGADLVYWRSEPDAFVIVQYKVLDRDSKGLIHRINGNDRLLGQLEAMLACTRPDGVPPAKVADFRLAGTSAFVKFAHPMTKLHTDHQLIDGHYLPAELVQLMYADPDLGRDGGKMLRFPPERSIDPETFSRLVRDCWIGTSGKASAALHRFLPGLRAMPPAHLVIAYDERRR
ncbi:hypothetical protein ACLQ24_17270 [Micromonospora sp. DT4]|uniref:hypothetical protein n=1 Tax=Micromonospora sp. DT4 TaxID=3393438 RepID=UPI003CEFDD34